MQHQEYDNAAGNMMEHPSVAWDHVQFKECLNKVANPEVYYRAINFYLNHQPQFLNEILISQIKKIDHTRVVTSVVKEHKYIKEYMLQAQSNNIAALNEAINGLLIEDEDFAALRISVDTYDNFDQVALAVRLEKHELLEMRRISAHLYKRNGKFSQSVDLSKRDRIYKDAIEAASASKDPDVTETLLRFFVAEHQNECFAATLFTCYDFVRADLALELAWRNGIMDFAMPFFIQYTKEVTAKVEALDNASKKVPFLSF
jgi:clathrin heavy chain